MNVATPAPVRVWEKHWALYRRMWRADAAGSLLQPLLYLLGMGIGVGALVDESGRADTMLDGTSYLAFLAPALIATTAMMTCASEALWMLFGGFKWTNDYTAMTATPLRPTDVVGGFALWVSTRSLIGASAVAAVLVLFDDTRSWGLPFAVLAGVLTGLAFALPLGVWTSTRDRELSFAAIMRFGIVPMFLFAGAFFPIDQLPAWSRPLAYVTPLYHGVELCRGAVLGTLGAAAAVGHVAVLVAFAGTGYALCRITFTRRLRK
jgi:lipooligosaccharide transport system permease protein